MFGNRYKICIRFAVYMNKTYSSFICCCQTSLVDWQEMSQNCPPPPFFLSQPKKQTAKWVIFHVARETVQQNLADISKAWCSFRPKSRLPAHYGSSYPSSSSANNFARASFGENCGGKPIQTPAVERLFSRGIGRRVKELEEGIHQCSWTDI